MIFPKKCFGCPPFLGYICWPKVVGALLLLPAPLALLFFRRPCPGYCSLDSEGDEPSEDGNCDIVMIATLTKIFVYVASECLRNVMQPIPFLNVIFNILLHKYFER